MSYRDSNRGWILCCLCVLLIVGTFAAGIAGLIWGCNPNVPGGCPLGHTETSLVVSGHVGHSECCHRNKNGVCIRYCYPWYLVHNHPYDLNSEVIGLGPYNCTIEYGSEDTPSDAQKKVDSSLNLVKNIVTFDSGMCSSSSGSLAFWWFGVISVPCISGCVGYLLYFLWKEEKTSVAPSEIPIEPLPLEPLRKECFTNTSSANGAVQKETV